MWARIVEECIRVGGRPSIRDLAKQLGEPNSNLRRAINDHQPEWEEMA